MPRYRYRAVTGSGEVVEGELDASTQAGVIAQLRERGFMPIRADEISRGGATSIWQRDIFGAKGPSSKAVTLMTRELATLLGAGLPLERTLEILSGLADDARQQALFERLLDALRGGASLADALADEAGTFPAYSVSMVRAGEAGGALEAVLDRLADYRERSQEVRERVVSALIYPIIVLVMAGLSVILLLTVVIPEFKPLFADTGAELPLATRVVVALGDAFQDYWWAGLGSIILVYLVVRIQLARAEARVRWHRMLLGTPLFGDLIGKIEIARFARILGTLLANGVTVLNALSIAGDVLANQALRGVISDVSESLKQGKGLAGPLESTGLFPALAINLLKVGEETGRLEDMLLKIAAIYDQEVERTTQRMLAILVPAVTIGLGLLIAGIIGSVLAAMLSIYELPL